MTQERDPEELIVDLVQCAEKGDIRALAGAIKDAVAWLEGRGWRVCEWCGEVYKQQEGALGCPNCQEEEQ
jgi:rubrerythrin